MSAKNWAASVATANPSTTVTAGTLLVNTVGPTNSGTGTSPVAVGGTGVAVPGRRAVLTS